MRSLSNLLSHLQNFYPRPPRGGRLAPRVFKPRAVSISIHALREEGDNLIAVQQFKLLLFLSTPSARRATASCILFKELLNLFLSTPSARRATANGARSIRPQQYFYPRPPRGGRPAIPEYYWRKLETISIHALREEGDWSPHCGGTIRNKFLSTPSARRATWHTLGAEVCRSISIHALREEGDINLL